MEKPIAYYLPQFHPIPENDEWWGRGFTEWTNVGRAKPLFKGHYQPRVPADLGYYDLRLVNVMREQVDLAISHGVGGFCFWHYWFQGKELLETPVYNYLNNKYLSLPFCLAWANTSWTGIWNNDPKRVLLSQEYPGYDDYRAHFLKLLPFFQDSRYIAIDGRLVFVVYRPLEIPNTSLFFDSWNKLALEYGLNGFMFVAVSNSAERDHDYLLSIGYDIINPFRLSTAIASSYPTTSLFDGLSRKIFDGRNKISVYDYDKVSRYFITEQDKLETIAPTIIPGWDTSPRSGRRAIILKDSKPEAFEKHVAEAKVVLTEKINKMLFLKSWNEWAEGNYVEPDMRFGLSYLNVVKKYFY